VARRPERRGEGESAFTLRGAPNANEGRRFRQPSLRRSGGVRPGLGRTSVSAGSRLEWNDWASLSALREEWRTARRQTRFQSRSGLSTALTPLRLTLRSPQTARKLRRCPAGAFPQRPKPPCSEPLRGSHQCRSTGRSLSDPAPFDSNLATQVSLCLIGRQSREILANLWSYLGCSTKLPPSQSLGGSPQRPRSGGFVSRPGLVRFLLSPEGEKPVPAGPQPFLSLAPRSLRPIRLPLEGVTLF